MPVSGHSGTQLIKRLGIREEIKIRLINPPDNYCELLGEDITQKLAKTGGADFVHLFAVKKRVLEKDFNKLSKELPATAVIWISWYKKSAKIPTDITEDTIREIVLPTVGLM